MSFSPAAAGTFIPIEDHHLLREDFEEFEEGEYVGYEIEDDLANGQTFVYAIIMEKVRRPRRSTRGGFAICVLKNT